MSSRVKFGVVLHKFLVPLILLLTAIAVISGASCTSGISHSKSTRSGASPTKVATIEATPSPSPTPRSPIRQVDFGNMIFPAYPIYPKGEKPFELTNGEYEGRTPEGAIVSYQVQLSDVVYGDVTRDGQDDAMVLLTERVQGMSIPYYIYVYTLEADKLNILWAFETGDRGDGGLKQFSAYDGDLVIELYGKGTFVDGNLLDQEAETPAPYANFYTRSRYKWNGKRFEMIETEVLPNPGGQTQLKPR